MNSNELAMYENSTYEYAFKNVARKIDRATLDAFKENSGGITLKEAMTSDELSLFIPQIFTDEIVPLGMRVATARNNFPAISQTTGVDFKIRFRQKTEGAQVLRELDEFQHSRSDRFTRTFSFNKIGDFPLFSFELLMDSPLDEVTDEILLSTSKIWRRENQLAWDQVTRFSQGSANTGAESDFWGNHIDGVDCQDSSANDPDASDVLASMEDAYLSITTALQDSFPQASLRWYMSPTVFTLLWKEPTFRRFDVLGAAPTQVTGRLPEPYGIPMEIIDPGYFDTKSNYIQTPCDIYLIADEAMRLREKVSLRTQPITLDRIQATGPLMWERIAFYPRNPLAYRRISPNEDYENQIPDSANVKITVKSE